jgi:hypothetical protein
VWTLIVLSADNCTISGTRLCDNGAGPEMGLSACTEGASGAKLRAEVTEDGQHAAMVIRRGLQVELEEDAAHV